MSASSFKCACCDPFVPQLTENAKRKRRVSPLRADPSRTAPLVARFMKEIRRRFNLIKREVHQLIVTEDALALKAHSLLLTLAEQRRWQFYTSDQKAEAYNVWLQGQIDKEILTVPNGQNAWTTPYVQSAYKQGIVRAYTDSKKIGLSDTEKFQKGRDEFSMQVLGAPETASKLRLIYSRTYSDLRGVTQQMGTRMSRTLTTGLADGIGAVEMGRRLEEEVGLSMRRAFTIARTEIMNAHAEGQLDAFEELGVDELGVMAEWSAAGDDRVCPVCQPLEGMILKVKEARGMIPRHPNCRCTWIPANVTEKEAGQKRTRARIDKAIKRSLEKETRKKDPKEAKEKSRWVGADRKISAKKTQRPLRG